MQELSMNVLDIAQNSVKACATLIRITVDIDDAHDRLTLSVADNGSGMDEETVRRVTDPFYTTRTSRDVGLGLPFLQMAAQMTGGQLDIDSTVGAGTAVTATFTLGHIDLMPLGDMSGTVAVLMQCNPDIDFIYLLRRGPLEFSADSREFKAILDGVPISTPQVALFIQEYIEEHSQPILKKEKPLL